jgi:hypothetical protein
VIKEVDNVQIGDVLVDRVGFKDTEECIGDLETLFGTKTY